MSSTMKWLPKRFWRSWLCAERNPDRTRVDTTQAMKLVSWKHGAQILIRHFSSGSKSLHERLHEWNGQLYSKQATEHATFLKHKILFLDIPFHVCCCLVYSHSKQNTSVIEILPLRLDSVMLMYLPWKTRYHVQPALWKVKKEKCRKIDCRWRK
jgi:hypothetical protein